MLRRNNPYSVHAAMQPQVAYLLIFMSVSALWPLPRSHPDFGAIFWAALLNVNAVWIQKGRLVCDRVVTDASADSSG